MYLKVNGAGNNEKIDSTISIPGSKSHSIRALFLAGLAQGCSNISNPLISGDTLSACTACSAFGAEIEQDAGKIKVKGFNSEPGIPDNVIDIGNSGTTLRFALMTASLSKAYTVLTGDGQIRKRPLAPLINCVNELGGEAFSLKGNGMAPVAARGRIKGGKTSIDAFTSQFLSSLLIHVPLLENDTEITVTRLNEAPYVEMTLRWLDRLNIRYSHNNMRDFYIPGNQKYKAFDISVPGDFSSATFFAVLAAISGGRICLRNLDMNDSQGDKAVFGILQEMGAKVSFDANSITIQGNGLKGMEIDMNAIPDALPAMAVAGCFAEGETRLVNVPQARFKETDRINVMCGELSSIGAIISELPDGLVIRKSRLCGGMLHGHGDHRIVMALAIAGLNIKDEVVIDTAEAINITFPEFADLVRECGGNIEISDDI